MAVARPQAAVAEQLAPVPTGLADAPDWVRDAVFYQIFPDRFASSDRVSKPGPLEPWDTPPTTYGFKGGDLLGIVERLDYLTDLGVNAIYLNPIFASASNHRYHTYDYYTVDALLGGNDALRELLDTAHARGIRIVLDGVFNHTGRGFWPFHHVLETGAASPYREWFHFDQEALDAGRPILAYPGAHRRSGVTIDEPVTGEASPESDGGRSLSELGFRAWWDLPALPKLNVGNPAVREYLLSVAEHWLRIGIDGWRLDVPEEIDDRGFWQEFRRRCREVKPDAYIVGEIWHVAAEWLEGDRFDALMNYPLAEGILSFVGARHLDESIIRSHHEFATTVHPLDGTGFARHLEDLFEGFGRDRFGVQLNVLDSHDSPRFVTMAGGDRAALRLAMLLQATLPGAPCIYYGDEVGLEGGPDPDCRRAFPWDATRWDRGLREFVRQALALRHAHPAIRRSDVRILAAEGDAIVYERRDGREAFLVALNAGEAARSVPIDIPTAGAPQVLLATNDGQDLVMDRPGRLELPARSGFVGRTA
jgi:cyclomaltodextrinase / maltogenic alpha-amylase / neopullulanase